MQQKKRETGLEHTNHFGKQLCVGETQLVCCSFELSDNLRKAGKGSTPGIVIRG